MQIFNLSEDLRTKRLTESMQSWILIHAIGAYQQAHGDKCKAWEPKEYGGTCDSSRVEIELKVNGVEVDFVEFMDRLAEGRKEYVARKAVELFEEKMGAAVDSIHKVTGDAVRKFRTDLRLPDEED